MSANAEWKKYFHLIDDGQPDGIINDFKLKLYDIRSNNICNFKCRTCSGSYSSSIASEEASLGWPARSQARQNANHQTFMESVMSQIDDVESFYFAGGEPLMMIEHYNLLERLIAANRTDVSITYNTNASNLSFKGKHICDLWKHFSDINVGLSLDGMEVVAEYLRHGTKWSTILANIDEIRYKTPHVKLKVTSVWSIYNCYHLLDFHKWLITSGYFDPDSIKLEHSMGDDFDVRILDSNIKQELSSKINEMIHWLGELGSQDLIDYWRSALLHLNSKDMSHLMPAFLRRNKVLDAARNESLFRSIPNLANMLDHETDNVVK
jgi:sulfatase maturation enzyme AslB (radical SAM superfamily)